MTDRYGLPYMGSKSKIARWVVERLPESDTLYDVFCGGCAITDYAMRARKYKSYVVNDITNIGFVFKKALDGGFRNETRWIDRKTYFENLEDPYVYLCFSFGINPVCRYAYAVEIEPWKKALHWCYVFNDPSLIHEYGVDIPVCDDKAGYRKWIRNNEAYIRKRYCSWVDAHRDEIERESGLKLRLERLQSLGGLERLESLDRLGRLKDSLHIFQGDYRGGLERLESLDRLGRLKDSLHIFQGDYRGGLERLESLDRLGRLKDSLHIFQGDYRDVVIPKSSGVVYCDPPYRNTASYYDMAGGEKRDLTKIFDYDSFYAWCEYQSYVNKNPVFVSSYDLPSSKFRRVASVDKGSSLNGGQNHYDDKIEGLYVPKEQACDLVDYVQVKLF